LEKGYKQIVELLLVKGANVNAQGGDYGNALQAASAEGHKQIAELLLAKGAEDSI
jgi:ankyrin repeat protein